MLSADKRGIICDRCAMNIKEKFTYFSFDIDEISVSNNIMNVKNTVVLSLDICPKCFDDFKNSVIKNYKPYRIVDNRSCPNGIFCDLSGAHMYGTFTCYHITVSYISVDVNASVNVIDDEYVELYVSDSVFASLRDKSEEIKKNKDAHIWSSETMQAK